MCLWNHSKGSPRATRPNNPLPTLWKSAQDSEVVDGRIRQTSAAAKWTSQCHAGRRGKWTETGWEVVLYTWIAFLPKSCQYAGHFSGRIVKDRPARIRLVEMSSPSATAALPKDWERSLAAGLRHIDAYARRIVGWRTSSSMQTDLALDILDQVLYDHPECAAMGLVHHSDRGVQSRFKRGVCGERSS